MVAQMGERIDWRSGQPHAAVQAYVVWRDAVEQADAGDMSSLVALLRSDADLGPDSRDLVADLLARHNLAKRKGAQANKAYRITLKKGEEHKAPEEGKLRMAAKLVEYYRRRTPATRAGLAFTKGMSVVDAVWAALRDNKRDTLEIQGDPRARIYSDEEIIAMIPAEDQPGDKFTPLFNRVMRGKRRAK
jgi:hypothetical protein